MSFFNNRTGIEQNSAVLADVFGKGRRTSSSWARQDSREGVGKTRGVKLTLMQPTDLGAGGSADLDFLPPLLSPERELKELVVCFTEASNQK